MAWARWLVDHAVTVAIGVLGILLFGIISYVTLPREASPDITIPVVIVSTPYIGVSPEDIESLVTVPMERKLKDLRDVDKMTSTSMEGASVVVLEFNPDAEIEDALQKVREKVDAAERDIPEDAEDTVVSEISFSDIPIFMVSMTGPIDEEDLKQLGEDLADEIEAVPGVLDVTISGGLRRELKVYANPDRMALYDVSFNDIMFGLQAENVNIPGGTVDAASSNYLLRIPGELKSAADIEDVPIKNVGDQTVFVRDVARVVDGFAERTTYARMNGTPSISLGIKKSVGENIIDIADSSREVITAAAETWPEGVEYSILADQSREIESMVGELENNILSGLILVVAVLLFFMGFRNSWFVGLAIPLSMFMSFMILQALDITLNMVVLFSLILALGMLVDNAIVIVENIYRHAEMGKSLKDASVDGVSEVALPVATSTLTTVLAFAPMLFWEGIMGEFMGFLPKTLIIVLSSSLFVALIAIPTATSVAMKKVPARTDVDASGIPQSGLYAQLMRGYKWMLEWSIDHRYISFFGLGIPSLILTMVIYGIFNHGTEFFPETEPKRAIVQVTAPHGTNMETTDAIIRSLEQVIAVEPDVDTYVTEVGVSGGADGFGFGSSSSPHSARITIDFKPLASKAREGEEPRVGSTFDAIERIRMSSTQVVGAKVVVDKIQEGPPVGLPISVEITGDDFHELGAVSADFQRRLAQIPGVVDISDDYKVGRPELRVDIDEAAAKRVGASTSGVANNLRTAVAGAKASVLREGDEEYDIVVELEPAFKNDLQSVLQLRVPGKDNLMVPLSTLASFEVAGGSGAIKHKDRQKIVTLNEDVAAGFRVDLVQASVVQLMKDYDTPDGVRLGMGGANEEEIKAMAFLLNAFLIALGLIFLVLVTQFDSVTRPFIIMMSVALSLIGVLMGLLITGTPFGIMMTGVGVIALAGVVVNNAIVLLDYVQLQREQGLSVKDSLVTAGLVRFRPVILTAITTILGLLPMATGVSVDFRKLSITTGGDSASFWGPMAIAVCFGLAVATVLTLVMVPTMYSINEDISDLIGRIGRKLKIVDEPPKAAAAIVTGGALLLALLPGTGHAAERVSLEDALRAAEQNNLDLKIVHENTVQAKALYGQAWSSLSPKLQAGANYTYNKDEISMDFTENALWPSDMRPIFEAVNYDRPDVVEAVFDEVEKQEAEAQADIEPIVIQAQDYFDWNVSVIQPLFNAPALPALRGTKANRSAATLDEEWTRAQVLGAVTRSYYALVVAQQSVDISTGAVDNAAAHAALARKQVEVGLAAPLAASQAELALARSRRQLKDAQTQLVRAQEVFALFTGITGAVEVAMPAEPRVSVGSLDEALGQRDGRADLQAAALRQDMAQYQLRADQLGWLPRVDGRFTYSWTENEGFSGEKDWWMLTVGATWTAWDGGYRLNTSKAYKSQYRQAQYIAERSRLEADQQIRMAWQSYERAQTSYAMVQDELALAEDTLGLATRGFEAGANSWLDVQDAELMVQQARLGMLSERMNRDLAALDLELALGAN